MTYQSFKARAASVFFFHVWWLKEFKNRWFAVGVRNGQNTIIHLALDRIIELKIEENIAYRENSNLDPELFYRDAIDVTVSENMRPDNVKIWVNTEHAPYVETKPLHRSQLVLEKLEDGIIIQICVQLNFELEKEILGFGEGMKVLSPEKLKKRIFYRMNKGVHNYES